MVEDGVLERLSAGRRPNSASPPRFREIAMARIVEPLARDKAQMLVAHLVRCRAAVQSHGDAQQVRDRGDCRLRQLREP